MRFLASGYQAVSLRAIAADAGVDVALVSYYFGSKQGLFNDAMEGSGPAQQFQKTLEGDLDTLGRRILIDLLGMWDGTDKGGSMRAIMCESAVDPAMNQMMRQKIERDIIGPLARRLGGGPDAIERAAAFACQIVGITYSRYILETEPAASMSASAFIELMAPSLQAALGPAEVVETAH